MVETHRSHGTRPSIFHNVVSGLTVSFVAISLGAAFGVLSGRGAFAGIMSAGIIALVTAALGGTRVQCSGPTAPMTAVSAVVVAMAHDRLLRIIPGADPDRFINLVFLLTGIIVLLFALFRLGRFIRVVPRVVVSGFMNGIAILIWVDQFYKLTGTGGRDPMTGSLTQNVLLAVVTFVLVFFGPRVLERHTPHAAPFIPVTLLTVVLMSVVAAAANLGVEHVRFDVSLRSITDFTNLVATQFPTEWSGRALRLALPFALQLAMLAYLDTLLTSLVVDKLSGEHTRQDRELAAQGLANGLISLVGGIPGAQATIRSVLIIKEGATLRLAGVLVGVFVLIEMVALQDLIGAVPLAVFTGILIKVGYDVFDWHPVGSYVRRLLGGTKRPAGGMITHGEVLFIGGTTAATLVWNLNAAVIGAALLFYAVRRWWDIPDLAEETATVGVEEED